MTPSEQVYIGLGANVGDARAALVAAVAALTSLPGVVLTGVSMLYRTRPVGPVAQDDFLNAVVGLRVPAGADPESGAMALLVALKGVELALDRQDRERWGPREIDLDLLLFGDHALRVERGKAARSLGPAASDQQWLEVPHPEAARRAFVLAPLADLAPALEPPGWGMTVTDARDDAIATEGPDAVKAVGRWHVEDRSWAPIPPR